MSVIHFPPLKYTVTFNSVCCILYFPFPNLLTVQYSPIMLCLLPLDAFLSPFFHIISIYGTCHKVNTGFLNNKFYIFFLWLKEMWKCTGNFLDTCSNLIWIHCVFWLLICFKSSVFWDQKKRKLLNCYGNHLSVRIHHFYYYCMRVHFSCFPCCCV